MASYTRKEFAELVGLEFNKDARAKVATWIKRGNIIIENDLISDAVQQNAYWIKRQRENIKESNIIESTPRQKEEIAGESTIIEVAKPKKDKGKGAVKDKHDLDIEKKELEIEKLKVDTRLQELKEEKIRGEVIPISLMKQLIGMLSQSIVTSEKDSHEYILILFSKEVKLTGDQTARLRGLMYKSLNESVDKFVNLTARNMKTLMNEFSIKKEIGEHE